MRPETRCRALLLAAAILAAAALPACKPMKPRPAQAVPSQEPPPPAAADAGRDRSKDPTPGDPEWQSSSALGKARDAAVRTKQKVDAYQQEVSRQADEVFKQR